MRSWVRWPYCSLVPPFVSTPISPPNPCSRPSCSFLFCGRPLFKRRFTFHVVADVYLRRLGDPSALSRRDPDWRGRLVVLLKDGLRACLALSSGACLNRSYCRLGVFHNLPLSGGLFGPRNFGAMLLLKNISLSLTKILWWFMRSRPRSIS